MHSGRSPYRWDVNINVNSKVGDRPKCIAFTKTSITSIRITGITNRGKRDYKLGQGLQIGVREITNRDRKAKSSKMASVFFIEEKSCYKMVY